MHRLVTRLLPDPYVLAAVAGLLAVGVVMVRGVTFEASPALSGDALRQVAYGVLGLLAFAASSRLPLAVVRRFAPVAYAGVILLLVVVLVLGTTEFGARRWIALAPGVTLQPSEFAKVGVVVALAAYAADREPTLRAVLTSLAVATLPAVLILVEPDLGTTLAMLATWVALMVAWSVPWRILGGIAALGVSLLPIALAVVPAYQRERLMVFFSPGHDPLGSGFTMRQVEVALGGGGLLGRGIDGAASALDGVATRTSDFAFAQVGEQLGLVGTLMLLLLFVLIAWRGLEAAVSAPDAFGRLLASGLTATIVLQALMHIGVNTRLFPATGIPLPFVSTGGSALVGMCLAAGLVLAVAAQRSPSGRERWRS